MEEEFSNVKITAVNPASCKRMMAGLKTILVRSWFPKLKKDEDLYIVEKPEKGDEETGLIVCIIKIKEVRDFTPADVPAACEAKWRPNYYSWEIHDLRVLDVPIPIKIQQEIFTLSLPKKSLIDVSYLPEEYLVKIPSKDNDLTYYQRLPKKRMAVGVVIVKDNKILIVKPNYRNEWLIPGGVVEANESPFQAAQRECLEEIGLQIDIQSILCVDYNNSSEAKGEAVHFLFHGVIKNTDKRIGPKSNEIIGLEWASFGIADLWLNRQLAGRVRVALKALNDSTCYYSQDGQIKA